MATKLDTLPIRVDFTCYRGDDWTRCFEPVAINPADGTSEPIDMTGWTGVMQIRDHIDGPVRATASSGNGRITTGPQSNSSGRTWQLMVYLSRTDTAKLSPGYVGRYDIELTKPDGNRTSFYYGVFRVEGDIST